MNRREFIKQTTRASVGVSMGMGAAAAVAFNTAGNYDSTPVSNSISQPTSSSANTTNGSKKMRNIKKTVKIGMVDIPGTILDKFNLLKELGFNGYELDSPSNLDIDEVIAARDATGLPIHGVVDSVHWQWTLSHPDQEIRDKGRQGLETAIKECKKYGGSTVLLVPAVVNQSVSYDAAYERSQTEIRKVIPLAEELNIKIALENVWNNFLLSPMEAARYVDELASSHIGWYFDVGNIVNYGWPEQWIRILNKRILKVDIKEFSRKKRDAEGLWKGFQAELFEGDNNWPEVMKALDDIEYHGWITAEIGGGGKERLSKIAELMDKIIAS